MKQQEYSELVKELKDRLKPGDMVYTKLNHVSRSGMQRSIEVMIIRDNEPLNLTYDVSQLLGYKIDQKHDGLKVGGCGMDMGFSVVYNLSSALYRESGYRCIEDKENNICCPSNFHVNNHDKTKTELIHHDGYALKHRWF